MSVINISFCRKFSIAQANSAPLFTSSNYIGYIESGKRSMNGVFTHKCVQFWRFWDLKVVGVFSSKRNFQGSPTKPRSLEIPTGGSLYFSFFPKKFSLVDFTQPYQAHSLHNISLVLLLLIFN